MNREKAIKVAEEILGYCSMGVAAELPHDEHVEWLTKAILTAPERLQGYLENLLERKFDKEIYESFEPVPEGELYSKKTEYGTTYGDIAKFVTSFTVVAGTPVYEYTDDMFYFVICEDLAEADQYLRYYLSDATENTLQGIK